MKTGPYKLGKSFQAKAQLCPVCDYLLDAATEARQTGQPPARKINNGDVSVCINCATPLVMEKDELRAMTDLELLEAPPILHAMILAVKQIPR